MKPFIEGIDEFSLKLKKMIRVHEMETGKRPEVVNIDLAPMTFDGVRVEFAKVGNYTASKEKVIHHKFKEQV